MNCPFYRTIVVVCGLLLNAVLFAATQVDITTADGQGADVYVEHNKLNFGEGALVIKNAARATDDPHVTRKVYLRFDLTAYQERLTDVTTARLSMTTSINHTGGNSAPARAYELMVNGLTDERLDGWDENKILWDNAPANVIVNNDLVAEQAMDLGIMNVPDNPDPDRVTFSSDALTSFIKTDRNGVITLMLRRMDSDAGHNLAFHSKETGEGSTMDGMVPTLTLTIGGEPLPMAFDAVIEGRDLGNGLYESPWFGRVFRQEKDIYFSPLGWLWTGAATQSAHMWIWNWTLHTWMWTNQTDYPWVYLMNEGWVYVYQTPENETFLYSNATGEWRAYDHLGQGISISDPALNDRLSVYKPSISHPGMSFISEDIAEWNDQVNEAWFQEADARLHAHADLLLSDQEQLGRVMIELSTASHPRILFNQERLPELKEKMGRGWFRDAYVKLKGDADRLLIQSNRISYSATLGRRIHQTIAKLAFVGYIEEDQRYFDRAIEFALYQLDHYTLEELERNNAGSYHLGLGDVLQAYAIAYDWLYPHIRVEARERLQQLLIDGGTLQYADLKDRYDGTDNVSDSSNHNAVANGGLGLAALALGDRPEWLAQAIRQNDRYLAFSTDADGWNYEGRGYLSYGGWGCFPFSMAVDQLHGPDLIGRYPKYEKVAVDFLLRQMPPYSLGKGVAATASFVSRYQDRVGHWLWLHTQGKEGGASYGSSGDIDHSVYTLLWGNPDLEPLAPIDADLPLDKVFENGRALFRDGWDEMAAVLSYSTGWTVHTGHRMRSENSFNFYALGEEFSISPEDAQTRIASLHSLVMVDGRRNSRDAGENRYGSEVEAVRTEPDHSYIRGNAANSAAYFIDADGWKNPYEQKVSVATRQILFARSPENLREPYLVIVDDLTARADSAKFSWLLQTKAQNQVELQEGGNFKITGDQRGAILDVEFIAPSGLTNTFVTHTGFVENKGRWSAQKIASYLQTPAAIAYGKTVRFIAILRAHEPGTVAPAYTYTGTDHNGQITIQLSDGTTDVIGIQEQRMTFLRAAP